MNAWLASHVIFPSSLSSFSQGSWRDRTYEVWHWCDDFICRSLAGDVMKWVTERSESARSKEMALHFIERCAFVIHFLVRKPSAFVYRQVSTRRCQGYKWFMESIYRASTWPSQSIYYVAQETTGSVWMNFIVLPQRSNSINAIKLLNPLALTKLGNRQMDL